MAEKAKVTAAEMVRNGGLTNFRRAVRFAARYGQATSALAPKLGRAPTINEYRDWYGMSEAQAFKEQAAWRRCMGDGRTVLDVVSEEAWAKKGLTEEQRAESIAVFLMEN